MQTFAWIFACRHKNYNILFAFFYLIWTISLRFAEFRWAPCTHWTFFSCFFRFCFQRRNIFVGTPYCTKYIVQCTLYKVYMLDTLLLYEYCIQCIIIHCKNTRTCCLAEQVTISTYFSLSQDFHASSLLILGPAFPDPHFE